MARRLTCLADILEVPPPVGIAFSTIASGVAPNVLTPVCGVAAIAAIASAIMVIAGGFLEIASAIMIIARAFLDIASAFLLIAREIMIIARAFCGISGAFSPSARAITIVA